MNFNQKVLRITSINQNHCKTRGEDYHFDDVRCSQSQTRMLHRPYTGEIIVRKNGGEVLERNKDLKICLATLT